MQNPLIALDIERCLCLCVRFAVVDLHVYGAVWRLFIQMHNLCNVNVMYMMCDAFCVRMLFVVTTLQHRTNG